MKSRHVCRDYLEEGRLGFAEPPILTGQPRDCHHSFLLYYCGSSWVSRHLPLPPGVPSRPFNKLVCVMCSFHFRHIFTSLFPTLGWNTQVRVENPLISAAKARTRFEPNFSFWFLSGLCFNASLDGQLLSLRGGEPPADQPISGRSPATRGHQGNLSYVRTYVDSCVRLVNVSLRKVFQVFHHLLHLLDSAAIRTC